MSEEQVAAFLAKYDEVDTDGTAGLNAAEFKKLYTEVFGKTDDEGADLYFNGIDINGDGSVSREEFKAFVVAALNKDHDYTVKLIFRAFDKDRSQKLSASEVQSVAKYVGQELSDEDVAGGIERITGDRNGSLSYAQIVKLLLDKEVPEEADPYDGKLKPKPAPAPAEPAPAAAEVPPPPADPAAAPPAAAKPPPDAAKTDGVEKSKCCLLL
jgi:Ca2+-binding EF-hand superfamily protein